VTSVQLLKAFSDIKQTYKHHLFMCVLSLGMFFTAALLCCSYNPGDVLMIQPRNPARHVDTILRLFSLDPNALLRVEQNDPGEKDCTHGY
jgi:sulfite reductase alpha subunit-like flavoprotein